MTVIDGPTLRALRIQRRVPLRKVARMARMSHGHLSKVERKEAGRPVTPAVLAAYGQAIGVDLTDIKPSDTKGGWQPGQLNTSAWRWFTGKVAAVAWGAQLDDRLNQFLAIRGKLAPPTDIDQAQLSQLAALLASLPGPVPGLVARAVARCCLRGKAQRPYESKRGTGRTAAQTDRDRHAYRQGDAYREHGERRDPAGTTIEAMIPDPGPDRRRHERHRKPELPWHTAGSDRCQPNRLTLYV